VSRGIQRRHDLVKALAFPGDVVYNTRVPNVEIKRCAL